jgi:xanthine dehydrogenase/oxidase
MLTSETIVEHVIAYLKSHPLTIRSLNLYKEGDITHYGQVLGQWNIPRIFDELTKSSDFFQRQINVEQFNHMNIYRKRGLTLIPLHFNIDSILQFLNQTSSLLHIYKDGSVVLTYEGLQFNKDLQRKIISIAAELLGCNVDRIRINERERYGSITSDLNEMNIKHACELVRQRLDRLIIDNNVRIKWEDLIKQAYFHRIDLSVRGFYIASEMFDVDLTENRTNLNCFIQGAAVSEVELDVSTGYWHLLRVDILMVCSFDNNKDKLILLTGCWDVT